MEQLTFFFRQLVSMGIMALPVMAVVLAVRWALRRAPKRYSFALWLAVGLRLVCPWKWESPLSLYNLAPLEPVADTAAAAAPSFSETLTSQAGMMQAIQENAAPQAVRVQTPSWAAAADIAAVVWLVGLIAMLAWLAVSYVRLRRSVAQAVRRDSQVWECDGIPTPFVLGLVRPQIYIPFRLDDNQRTCVLTHERTHIRFGDQWTKLLATAILAVYWWHPGVWLCWVLFCRDMEMRCDEAVLETLGEQVKAGYSLSLVDFALDRRMPAALAFGEHDAARRVKNVLNWKKAAPALAAALAVLVAVVLVVCGTDALEQGSWVKPVDRETWEYRIDEGYRSALLYQEVWLDGQVTERTVLETWSLSDESREGTVTLTPEWTKETFRWNWNGRILGETDLPAMQGMVTLWEAVTEKINLTSDTVLATAAANGSYSIRAEMTENKLAVVLRLRLSDLERAELEAQWEAQRNDLAQQLFDLREDPAQLLFHMGAGALDSYEVSWSDVADDRVLYIKFDRPLTEKEDLWMCDIAYLLLALVPEADRVDYAYPTDAGGSRGTTIYVDSAPLDNWCKKLGYADAKEAGSSAQGLRELMAYLNFRLPEPGAVAAAAAEQPFTDILGHDGVLRSEGSFWQQRTYYAQENGEEFPIAESFGFGEARDYTVDLDGEDWEELVTNVTFGGDGHQDVYVYQRRGDGIWVGHLNLEDLPGHEDRGVNSTMAEYDPEAGVFRVQYAQKNTEEPGVLEFRGLERFEFMPFEAAE